MNKKSGCIFIFFVCFLSQVYALQLEFVPSSPKKIKVDVPFLLSVRINTLSDYILVGAAEIRIRFDPEYIEVVDDTGIPVWQLVPKDNFSTVVKNEVNNFLGYIIYEAGSTMYQGYQPTPVDFVYIYFRPKREGLTQIQFDTYSCEVELWNTKEDRLFSKRPDRVINSNVGIGEKYWYSEGGKPYNPLLDGNLFIKYNFKEEISFVILRIYSQRGNLLREVFEARNEKNEITWDGKDKWGKYVANGVYIYQVEGRGGGGVIYSKPKLVGVFK